MAGRPGYHFVGSRYRRSTLISRLLQEYQVRAVLNFAADRTSIVPSTGQGISFKRMWSALSICSKSVRAYWTALLDDRKSAFRFLHVFTDEVYGSLQPNDPPFSETNPTSRTARIRPAGGIRPSGARLASHIWMPVLTTNCSNNYGPYHFPEKLIPLVILNAIAGKPLPIYGDGQQIRDWLYVKDHCSAIRTVLAGGKPGRDVQRGGWNEKPNLDVVKTICDSGRVAPQG